MATKLKKINVSGAPGPDGIHPVVLRELTSVVASPLALMFSKFLELSFVPKDWRHATIIPIFKKGQRQLVGNYRPVSLTSVVCKVAEAVIKDKIMFHLASNNILSPHQHGFRPARSCTSQLLEVMDVFFQFVFIGHFGRLFIGHCTAYSYREGGDGEGEGRGLPSP